MLLEKLCEELGVEVGEAWEANDGYTYTIEGKFLYRKASNSNDWGIVEKECYWKLLVGELKPKWKPKREEEYYVPDLLTKNLYAIRYWTGSEFGKQVLERGLAFKTKEEAIDCAINMIELAKHGI